MIETVFFTADGLRLHGTLHMPDHPAPPLVIGCHGLLATGESPKQKALADRLNRLGIAYFRFDHRGCGKSDGVFSAVTSFAGRCSDLLAAVSALKGKLGLKGPLGFFGSSLGGAVALWTAGDTETRAVATLAAPVRFTAIRVPSSYETDPTFSGMQREAMFFDIGGRLPSVHDVLVCHGHADQVVPFTNATEIYLSAAAPKDIVIFPGGDHPLSRPAHQQRFMDRTVGWFQSRLAPDLP